MASVNWPKAIKPLLRKYKNKRHPLEYQSVYQLVVMVLLSARDSDKHINAIAPRIFKAFPNIPALQKATPATIVKQLKDVRASDKKAKWLSALGKSVQTDDQIPLQLDTLTDLPGIGRKSANVILREAGKPAEGIVVDLHVVRVAPRLGIVSVTDPVKIEKQMMEILPQHEWDAGMAMSFLGREICRPKNPMCTDCVMNKVCHYYATQRKESRSWRPTPG